MGKSAFASVLALVQLICKEWTAVRERSGRGCCKACKTALHARSDRGCCEACRNAGHHRVIGLSDHHVLHYVVTAACLLQLANLSALVASSS